MCFANDDNRNESFFLSLHTRVQYLSTVHTSRDSVVGIATGYGLDDRGVGVRGIFSSPSRPDRLWGPPILLSNGYLVFFPRG
jgi:hypothetical protein